MASSVACHVLPTVACPLYFYSLLRPRARVTRRPHFAGAVCGNILYCAFKTSETILNIAIKAEPRKLPPSCGVCFDQKRESLTIAASSCQLLVLVLPLKTGSFYS